MTQRNQNERIFPLVTPNLEQFTKNFLNKKKFGVCCLDKGGGCTLYKIKPCFSKIGNEKTMLQLKKYFFNAIMKYFNVSSNILIQTVQ